MNPANRGMRIGSILYKNMKMIDLCRLRLDENHAQYWLKTDNANREVDVAPTKIIVLQPVSRFSQNIVDHFVQVIGFAEYLELTVSAGAHLHHF